MLLKEEREQVVEYGKQLLERNLSVGTFGNISIYNEKENLFAISPSGMDYYKTTPEDVVICTPEGEKVEGTAKPSSELDMHRIFYQKREIYVFKYQNKKRLLRLFCLQQYMQCFRDHHERRSLRLLLSSHQ